MGGGFSWLPGLALRRPVTVGMLLLAILVLGWVSYTYLQVELMPSGGREPRMWLQTIYPRATAGDILEQILEPVEEGLRTLPRLQRIRSRATNERASLSLQFHRGTDLNQAYLDVREKLERLRPELPDDFDRFTIWRWDNRSQPIFWTRVAVEEVPGVAAPLVLERIEQAIQRLPGVAKVELFGQAGQEVAVLIDLETAESLRADPLAVVEALRASNFSLPLGTLETGHRTHLVRAVARLDTLQQVAGLPLREGDRAANAPMRAPALLRGAAVGNGGGEPRGLRIGDLARVELRERERESYSKMGGRASVLMAIYKENTANTIHVGEAVRRALETVLPRDPVTRHGQVQILFGEDRTIAESMQSLQQTALWGAFFASIILLLFLRRLVPTFLVMAAIPISVLMTLVAMFFMGASLNILSMTGLMLALGMLVDNSVVVAENISRLRAEGAPPDEAAVRGTGEVGMAILMGTLTTVIVFVPLPFMGSRAFLSFIFSNLSFPITVSLVSSLVVAALFVPLAARYLLGATPTHEPAWFSRVREGYRGLLGRMLARRLDSAILLALLFATVWLPLHHLTFNLFGTNSMRRVRVEFTHSPVFGLPEIEAYFDGVMARLDARKAELGLQFSLVHYQRGGGRLSLFLAEGDAQPLERQVFFREVRKAIGEEPGVSYSLRDSGDRDFERMLTVRLLGPKPDALAELANEARRRLDTVEGLGEPAFEEERPPHELAVVVDRAQAERYGVTARETARRVAGALRGTRTVPRFRLGEEELEVVVQQDPERAGFAALTGLRFKGTAGTVPFDSVARIHFRGAPALYRRVDGKVSLDLEAPVEGKDFARVNGEVARVMNAMRFPAGYGWEPGGEGRRLREDRSSLGLALALALAAIFMVMGVLFESFLLPLTVLTTIPLALFGSAWLMFLTGTAMDTTGMIGMVILAGVVVNNGIVMVDRINRERRAGRGLEEAILDAGSVRLRPILLTALTTVFGLLPMVFGYTNVAGYSFVSMGRVVTGGLLAATVLTLFVVPLTYHTLVRIEGAIRDVAGRG